MNLVSILPYTQVILALILIALVLLQRSESGVGGAFGGGDIGEASASRRRGSERVVFGITIVVAFLFVTSAIASLFI